MYKLSLWARQHMWLTRFIIIGIYVMLNATGWLLGEQLTLNGLYLTPTHFYLGVVLALAGFVAYPSKSRKRDFKHFYRLQKTCDGLLATGTFVLIICLAQPQSLPKPWMGTAAQAATIHAPAKPEAAQKTSIFRKAANHVIKWLAIDKAMQQKMVKKWQQVQKEYKQTSTGGKIALITLSVLVAVALLWLLAGLSCTISCNGNEALAIVVFVLGLGAIILLLVKVIQRITRGPKRKQPAATDTPPANNLPM